ncbi:MAG TPA: hypothetical protein VFS43_43835 [Polyangiaceae bacterium]|nr:hypothetical protein [Polyangiaceae bacterium]
MTYAIRLLGPSPPPGARPARLASVDEGPSTLRLRVTCSGLARGAAYRLERRQAARDPEPAWAEAFTAAPRRFERTVEVESDAPARFHCAPR